MASQGAPQGGDIAGGQAGPSLSWLGAPAPAPGHRHHQELGLAGAPPPQRPRLGRLCCCPAGLCSTQAVLGASAKASCPREESERPSSLRGPLLRSQTPPKRRRPSSEAWGPERRLRWGAPPLARLSTPATPAPKCWPGCMPGAWCPRLCAAPAQALTRVLGTQRALIRRPGPTAACTTCLALSLGACAEVGGCPWQAMPPCCLLAPPAAVSWWAPGGRKGSWV